MRINAIIESKDGGTLVLDFPCNIYDVYLPQREVSAFLMEGGTCLHGGRS